VGCERPGLLFEAASGWPTHLITGVQRYGAGLRASDCSKKTGGTAVPIKVTVTGILALIRAFDRATAQFT
jgi:hypothetical protein